MITLASNTLKVLTGTEKEKLWALTFLDTLINILDMLFLAVLILIVNAYVQPGKATAIRGGVYSYFNQQNYWPLLVFFFLFASKNLLGYSISRSLHHFVYKVSLRISKNALSDYLQSDYRHFADTDSSVHVRRVSQQAIQFGQYILLNFEQIVTQMALVSIAIIIILIFNAKLFALLLIVVVPPVMISAWWVKKKLQLVRYNAKLTGEKAIQHLHEALNGFVESRIFGARDFFTLRFERYQERMNRYLANQQSIQGFPPRLIEVFAVLGLCALVLINKTTGQSRIPVILVGAFMGAAYKIIPGIVKILNCAGQIKAHQFTLTDILKNQYLSTDPLALQKCAVHQIEFDNISFGFKQQMVLKGVNFKMVPGDFVGIIGESGSGKTTIINLLIGFLEPKSGSIRINNIGVDQHERLAHMKSVAYAKQQPFLIHDSLRTNILLDNLPPAPEIFNDIISMTGVDRIGSAYAEGLEFIVAENGKNLSGGERQRIAFARALCKNSDCIILDEPFSELDQDAELSMMKHLAELSKTGKIVILISHNNRNYPFFNKIIQLND